MMTPYYADDLVTLYCADSLEHPELWVEGDVLITDPPYGLSWSGVGNYVQGNKRSSDEVTVKQIGLAIRPETGAQQPQTSAPVSSPSGWEEEPQQGAWGNTDAPF